MTDKLALFGGPKTVTLPAPLYPVIGAEEVSGAVQAILARQLSMVGHGGVVGQMEDAYAEYFGMKYCHSFNSGTAAIHSALFAVGVGPGFFPFPGRTSVEYRNLVEHPEERDTPAGQMLVNRTFPPPLVVIDGEARFAGSIQVAKIVEAVGARLGS